jgi:hypothetical protein
VTIFLILLSAMRTRRANERRRTIIAPEARKRAEGLASVTRVKKMNAQKERKAMIALMVMRIGVRTILTPQTRIHSVYCPLLI